MEIFGLRTQNDCGEFHIVSKSKPFIVALANKANEELGKNYKYDSYMGGDGHKRFRLIADQELLEYAIYKVATE